MQSGNNAEKSEKENQIIRKGKEKMKQRKAKEKAGAKIIPFGNAELPEAAASESFGKKEDLDGLDMLIKKASGTPRQRQENIRFFVLAGMAILMLVLMILCTVLSIRNAGNGVQVIYPESQGEVSLDNGENAGKEIDADALAKKILDSVAFDVALEKLDDSVAEGMIQTTDGTKLQIYMGNGTNADELVIMTAVSEKNAETNQEYVEEHLKEMKKQFELYIPEQVKKIDNAVKIRTGCYVVVCITSDTETAKRTIESFMKA